MGDAEQQCSGDDQLNECECAEHRFDDRECEEGSGREGVGGDQCDEAADVEARGEGGSVRKLVSVESGCIEKVKERSKKEGWSRLER